MDRIFDTPALAECKTIEQRVVSGTSELKYFFSITYFCVLTSSDCHIDRVISSELLRVAEACIMRFLICKHSLE